MALNHSCIRARPAKKAPRGPFRVLERRHGLADIGERGAGVQVERIRVTPPHPEIDSITFAQDASRHGHESAHQRSDFFETLQINKGRRVVVGGYEGLPPNDAVREMHA